MSNPYSDLMQHISAEGAKLRALHAAFAHRQLNQLRQIYYLIVVITVAVLASLFLFMGTQIIGAVLDFNVPATVPMQELPKNHFPADRPLPVTPPPHHEPVPGEFDKPPVHYVI